METTKGLQIGNLFYDKKLHRVVEIYALRLSQINDYEAYNFYPVKLTPDWLIKFGFKATGQGTGHLLCLPGSPLALTIFHDGSGCLEYIHPKGCDCDTPWDNYYKLTDIISNVHDLQNLLDTLHIKYSLPSLFIINNETPV
jgi:hypothetical protein